MKSKTIMERIRRRYERIPEKSKQEQEEMKGINQILKDLETLESLKESGVVEINELKSKNFDLEQKLTDKDILIQQYDKIIADLKAELNLKNSVLMQNNVLEKENKELKELLASKEEMLKVDEKIQQDYEYQIQALTSKTEELSNCVKMVLQKRFEDYQEFKKARKYLSTRLENATKSCVALDIENQNLKIKVAELEEQFAYECGCNEQLVDMEVALESIMRNKIVPTNLKHYLTVFKTHTGREMTYIEALNLFKFKVTESEFNSIKKILSWYK